MGDRGGRANCGPHIVVLNIQDFINLSKSVILCFKAIQCILPSCNLDLHVRETKGGNCCCCRRLSLHCSDNENRTGAGIMLLGREFVSPSVFVCVHYNLVHTILSGQAMLEESLPSPPPPSGRDRWL